MEKRRRQQKSVKNEYNNFNEPKKRFKNNKKNKLLIIGIVIAIIILAVIVTIYLFARSKLGKMQYEELNKDELGINNNLYNEVETTLSKKEMSQIINIALFGSDSRDINAPESGRSDTIIIASINPIKKNVKLISIPRDTYVTVKGYGKTKINHAYAYGKEQLSIRTINENFGLNIDKYVTINFTGLADIIDAIGGINANITKAEMEYINDGVTIWGDLGDKPNRTKLSSSGNVKLNGTQALVHSRNRTTGGSDFDRANKQREVLEAIMKKVSNMSKDKILGLIEPILEKVKTNISPEEYMGLFAKLFPDIKSYSNNLISIQIPSTEYSKGQMISGVYYFVTDLSKTKSDFQENIFNK